MEAQQREALETLKTLKNSSFLSHFTLIFEGDRFQSFQRP